MAELRKRTETFMPGSFPHDNNFISAINNPEDLKFTCTWSGDTVDMNVPYVHQPFVKGTWILIGAGNTRAKATMCTGT